MSEAQLKYAVLERVIDWLDKHRYKLPNPSGPDVDEIRVLAQLTEDPAVVDVIIFDPKTKKIKAVVFDFHRIYNPVIKRIDF